MDTLKSIWHYSNLLSLDVVFGAMAGMLFFSDVLDVALPFGVYLILGMAVWAIYTLDHLWDAKGIVGKASSERHRFHQQYFWILSWVLVITIVSGLTIVLISPNLNFILLPGLFLGFVMMLCMGALHFFGTKMSRLKEVSTSVFYVLGISLAPFFQLFPDEIPFPFYVFFFGYFMLALVNLLVLSYLDEKEDKSDGFNSILEYINKDQLEKIIMTLALLMAIIMGALMILLSSYFKIHALILLLLFLYHMLEFQKKDQIRTRQKLEASFLLPLLLVLF
jgi:hypothetical protein